MEKTAGNGSCKTNCEMSHIVSRTSLQVIAEKRNSEKRTVSDLFYALHLFNTRRKGKKNLNVLPNYM